MEVYFLPSVFYPQVFVDYNNPLFYSGGDRDILFYTHAFVISFALAWFWERFKSLFTGPSIVRGLKFGTFLWCGCFCAGDVVNIQLTGYIRVYSEQLADLWIHTICNSGNCICKDQSLIRESPSISGRILQ